MGLTSNDIRVFYNKRTKDYIVANDHKKRRLLSKGYSKKQAEKESHGHVKSKKVANRIRDNILANKREKSRDLWVLGCYVRVCDRTYRHYDWVCGLYKTKKEARR